MINKKSKYSEWPFTQGTQELNNCDQITHKFKCSSISYTCLGRNSQLWIKKTLTLTVLVFVPVYDTLIFWVSSKVWSYFFFSWRAFNPSNLLKKATQTLEEGGGGWLAPLSTFLTVHPIDTNLGRYDQLLLYFQLIIFM